MLLCIGFSKKKHPGYIEFRRRILKLPEKDQKCIFGEKKDSLDIFLSDLAVLVLGGS